MRLNLVYYGAHTPAIDARIRKIKPQYVIMNTLHGLWGEIYSRNVLQDTTDYKAAGTKVIGYLTAGYEGAGSTGNIDPKWYTLETNLRLIKNMAEIDHVDGIFIDECSAFPGNSSRTYLKTLTDLAHSYGLITWGNVGQDLFDTWYFTEGGFDLMQSSEDWQGQDLSHVQRDWGYRISVTGYKSTYTAQDAFNLTIDAWKKGLAYCYINDAGYDSISSWLEEYTGLLLEYNKISNTNKISSMPLLVYSRYATCGRIARNRNISSLVL